MNAGGLGELCDPRGTGACEPHLSAPFPGRQPAGIFFLPRLAGLGVTVGSDVSGALGMAACPGLCFRERVTRIGADPPGSGAQDTKARPLQDMGGAGAPGNFRG